MSKAPKKENKKTTKNLVTHDDINKLIAEIDSTNLIFVRGIQMLSLEIDNVKKEIYELHKKLISGPVDSNKKGN